MVAIGVGAARVAVVACKEKDQYHVGHSHFDFYIPDGPGDWYSALGV